MSLNIKDEKTHRLARELADITGESMTGAVSEAIRERLQRVRDREKKKSLAQRLLEIGQQCSAHLEEPYKSIDHGKLLYDEDGLPK